MKRMEMILRIVFKFCILMLVLLGGYWIHYGIEEWKSHKEMEARKEYNFTHEISPVTRGIHPDTVKCDTIR